mmetsp:Transcript_14714/g.37250  ORF Transcript_14714/g.37250 Transcript_14714/m.37250 type:complete len:103 (-) Transcript_14714:2258-2566(-)
MFGWLFKARGGESSGNGKEPEMAQFVKKVEQIISAAPLVVFSKTTCGYCSRAKGLLSSMSAKFDTVELDREESGFQMQQALKEITGQRTVRSPALAMSFPCA